MLLLLLLMTNIHKQRKVNVEEDEAALRILAGGVGAVGDSWVELKHERGGQKRSRLNPSNLIRQ